MPVWSTIAALLAKHGFTEVSPTSPTCPEQIREHFGDGSEFGIELTYSEEPEPLGTAGGVGKARDFLAETESFLVISGDALTDIDLSAMRDAHEANVAKGSIATLATKRVDDTTQFGVVITDDDGRIQGFQEKPDPAEALSDLANCGIYMFRREIFDHFPAPDHQQPRRRRRPAGGLRRLGDGRLPGAARRRRPLLLARDRRLLERHRLGRGVRPGQLRRPRGKVGIAPPADEVAAGIYAGEGSDLDAVKVKPPVLIGAGCEIGVGADLRGPVVIGDGCKVGPGAMIREAVVLPRAELGEGPVVVGGVYGTNLDRPLG